jgi:hypothetical protein
VKQSNYNRLRRAELRAAGVCVNGLGHGPATHGVKCGWCHDVTARGIDAVLADPKYPRPSGRVRGLPLVIKPDRSCECECGNRKRPDADACDLCEALDAQRVQSITPRNRILAHLGRVDEVDAFDLYDALDVPHGKTQNGYSAALGRLVAEGLVERIKWHGTRYRLVREAARRAA